MQAVIQSERLILRPFSLADASQVQRLAGRRELAETTLNIPHPYEDGMAEEWILSHSSNWTNRVCITYAISLKNTRQLVGAVSLSKIENSNAELGYWIGLPYWGNGYCTEAASKLIELAPSEFQIFKIRAVHLLTNPASGKILQKIGFNFTGNEQMLDRNGDMVDVGVYVGYLDKSGIE